MKRLAVIIPLYCSQFEALEIISIVEDWNSSNFDIVFIDDCFSDDLISSENFFIYRTKLNMGKFWSVNEVLKIINNDFFLTIDPDDILSNNIKDNNLNRLAKKINKTRKVFDYAINSYAIKGPNSKMWKKINSSKVLVYFNPCLIYSRKNIIYNLETENIRFKGERLTFFDDLLWIFLSYGMGRNKKYHCRFYYYLQYIGITSNRKNVYKEILQAKDIYDNFIKNNYYILNDKRMKNRDSSIKKRALEAIKVKNES